MPNSRTIATALLSGLLFTIPCSGEEVVYTRFLVPLNATPVMGAFGSIWEIDTWIYNAGPHVVEVVPGTGICPFTCPFPPGGDLEPFTPPTPVFSYQSFETYGQSGVLYHVDSRYASEVKFASRIRDLSRQAESAGTEIPIIREDRMSAEAVDLINVPITPMARNHLRIYALPEIANPEVEVQFVRALAREPGLPDPSVVVLRRERIRLRTFRITEGWQFEPSIADFAGWEMLPELAGRNTVWIRVVPITPGLRIWAFVSVTNNATQQVTIISP